MTLRSEAVDLLHAHVAAMLPDVWGPDGSDGSEGCDRYDRVVIYHRRRSCALSKMPRFGKSCERHRNFPSAALLQGP